jgi:hypothetical protein
MLSLLTLAQALLLRGEKSAFPRATGALRCCRHSGLQAWGIQNCRRVHADGEFALAEASEQVPQSGAPCHCTLCLSLEHMRTHSTMLNECASCHCRVDCSASEYCSHWRSTGADMQARNDRALSYAPRVHAAGSESCIDAALLFFTGRLPSKGIWRQCGCSWRRMLIRMQQNRAIGIQPLTGTCALCATCSCALMASCIQSWARRRWSVAK